MKIFKFLESNIYEFDWNKFLPDRVEVFYDKKDIVYKRGNIMRNADMTQVIYSHDEWGVPSDLEFDFYFENNGHFKVLVDITVGDAMKCEFSVTHPNKVIVIQQTSYGSKFDPRNVRFGFSDNSISNINQLINQLGFPTSQSDFKFLSK